MQILRSQSNLPIVKTIGRVWDHYKDARVATKPEERKWYMPEPCITWEAESLADLQANFGKVEVNDKIFLPKARWWPAKGEYRIKLKDQTGEMEFNLVRNPFYREQPIFPRGYERFGWEVNVPRVLLAGLTPSRAGCEIHDIQLGMRPLMEDPTKGLEGFSKTETELVVWDVHINPGEKRGFNPARGFRSIAAHPEVDENSLK